jgi:hypothetical protein
MDTLPGWPGDGGFGELCDGAGNCNCYLEYLDDDGSSTDAESSLSSLTNSFYQQRAAEEDQHDADAVAARQADIDYVASQSPDAAARMQARDAAMGVPGTRTGPGGRYDISAGANPELVKGSSKTIRKLVDFQFTGQYPPDATSWINDAHWSYDPEVPLSKINSTRKAGTYNKQTVADDAARFKAGHQPSPLVLVKQPDGTFDIADGNHRALALSEVGKTTAPGFIADMGSDPLPDLDQMQDEKLYKMINDAVHALYKDGGPKGDPEALRQWYNNGASGQINWGSDGDFDACVAIAGKYMDNPQGYCNLRHQDATGAAPGHAAGESKTVVPLIVKSLPVDIISQAEVGDRLVDDEAGITYVIKLIGDGEVGLEEI